jgi:hypothetical protein
MDPPAAIRGQQIRPPSRWSGQGCVLRREGATFTSVFDNCIISQAARLVAMRMQRGAISRVTRFAASRGNSGGVWAFPA